MDTDEAFLKSICIQSNIQSVLARLLTKLILKHPDCVSTNPRKALPLILLKKIYCLRKISACCNTEQLFESNKSTLRKEIDIEDLDVECILNIMKTFPGFLSNPGTICQNRSHQYQYEEFRQQARKLRNITDMSHPAWNCTDQDYKVSHDLFICCSKCQRCGKCNSTLTISKQCKVYRLISALRVCQSLQSVATQMTKTQLRDFLDGKTHLFGFPEVSNWDDMVLLVLMNLRNILSFIGDRAYKEVKEDEFQNILNEDSKVLKRRYAKEISRYEDEKRRKAAFERMQNTSSETRSKIGLCEKLSGQSISSTASVTSYSTLPDYYHGRIERDAAEALLRKQKDGTYLLRQTYSDGSYYLSYKFRCDKVMHVRIENNGSNKYLFPNSMVRSVFPSLPTAVDVFMREMKIKFPFLSAGPLKFTRPPPTTEEHKYENKNHMKQSNRFENCFWYFPKLSRAEATVLLSSSYPGTYLMRDSSARGSYALTFKAMDGNIRNLLIRQRNGNFEFATKLYHKNHLSFPTAQIAALFYMDFQRKQGFVPIPYGFKTYV